MLCYDHVHSMVVVVASLLYGVGVFVFGPNRRHIHHDVTLWRMNCSLLEYTEYGYSEAGQNLLYRRCIFILEYSYSVVSFILYKQIESIKRMLFNKISLALATAFVTAPPSFASGAAFINAQKSLRPARIQRHRPFLQNRLMSTTTDICPGRPTWQQTMIRIKQVPVCVCSYFIHGYGTHSHRF
jgi:hypothetical protein